MSDQTTPDGVPTVSQMGRYLMVIALFGAARQDASGDPDRIRTLKDIADMLREPAADRPLEDIVKRVFWCMGPTWVPTGTFGDWIDNLLAERDRGEWTE